MTKIRKSTSNR